MRVLLLRRLAIRGTAVVAALAVALAGCGGVSESPPSGDRAAQPLPALPSIASDPGEADVTAELLALLAGFREVEAELYADPPPPDIVRRDLSPYLGDTMLSELVGTLHDLRDAGVVFEGQPKSNPIAVDVELNATPSTATVRDCVDATDWRPVFEENREPVAGERLPDRFVMALEATEYPDHGWLFYDFAMEVDTPC